MNMDDDEADINESENEIVLEENVDNASQSNDAYSGMQNDLDFADDVSAIDELEPQPKKQATSNKIVLPFSLKHAMLKTWEQISQHHLIPSIPAKISVKRILEMYVEAKIRQITRSNPQNNRLLLEDERIKKRIIGWKDMTDGIALFFDKALESRLLYPQEKPQLDSLVSQPEHSNKRMCENFGCEHLLRLLLRLPDILAECVAEDKRRPILDDMKDFVRFLHQHQSSLLSTSYHGFTKEELREHKQMMATVLS